MDFSFDVLKKFYQIKPRL